MDMPDPKNVMVAAEMLYLASTEAKIHWFMSRIFLNIAITSFADLILDY